MTSALAFQSLDQSEWSIMRDMAGVLLKTGFLPKSIQTPEQALAIMLKGRELDVPPMQALAQIVPIQGKPTASSELMLALIYRDHGDNAIRVTKSDNTICTVAYARPRWPQAETFSFTIEDARQANLTGKETWKAFPQAMLRARCISAVARMAFADSIGGMYTPEEMGATVNEDGEIVNGVAVSTGEIVGPRTIKREEPTPIRILNAAAYPQPTPAPSLADLRDNYAFAVAKASEMGLAAPALPPDADEATIRTMGKAIGNARKLAKEAGLPEAFDAALKSGADAEALSVDITSERFLADPAAYLASVPAVWAGLADTARPF